MSSFLLRFLSLFLFLSLFAASAWTQISGQFRSKATLRVDVVFPNGSHAGAHLHVKVLRGMNGTLVGMDSTNSSGTAEFNELDPGDYDVQVSGDDVQPGDSGGFTIEETRDFMSVSVTVKPAANPEQGMDIRASASVAAVDLNVPKPAAKEYSRAGEEMSNENWTKAISHLEKAVAIYPQYSSAYNDIGVCYGRLKQEDKQREALTKAISVNDHCVPALVNLAHLQMKENQLPDAAATLGKAMTAAPSNVEALTLLTQVDFMQGHYDQSVIDAHRAHFLAHHSASVHYTAASALQKENRTLEAIIELQMFLQEEPQGPRADAVRRVLGAMRNGENQAQSQPQSSAPEKDGAAAQAGGGAR